jgi:hypothetical protein
LKNAFGQFERSLEADSHNQEGDGFGQHHRVDVDAKVMHSKQGQHERKESGGNNSSGWKRE